MPAFILTLLAAAAGFVIWSSGQLPERVASHFGVSGQADAFVARSQFITLMVIITTAVPGFVWALQRFVARKKKTNIPHREYWFSKERYAATLRYLDLHAAWFTVGCVVFLCVVHWLVVQANVEPHGAMRLNTPVFLIALGLFFAFTIGWVAALFVRFRRRA